MRKIAALAFLSCIAVPAFAQDGPQSALQGFVAGFNAMDPDAMARLFRPDSTFFGSTEPDLLRGPDGARGYFVRAWPQGSRFQISCETLTTRELSPALATVNAVCGVQFMRADGQTGSARLRLTGLVMRDAQGWRFADLHGSGAPPARR